MIKIIKKHFLFLTLMVLSAFLIGCKKEKVPIVSTNSVSTITATTAICGGNITDDGGATIISRGVCWSNGITPTVADNKTSDGAGAGNYSSNMTGLNGGSVYYVRAFATNSAGTGYGMVMSFTTLGQSPIPTVAAATNLSTTGATLNGAVNPNYLSTVVTFEYGATISYGSTTTATQSPVTGSANTNVSADITGLTPGGSTYHFRIKAVNSLGTTYSNDKTFSTLGQAPTATTQQATNVNTSSATLNGSVNANYMPTVVTFEYGTTTAYGNTITATQSPINGNSSTNVNINITGLAVATTYHYRVKTENSLGTNYGSDLTFTTLGQVPSISTLAATNITTVAAQLNGTVNANYLSTVVTFEYGITTAYGNTVSATQSPVTGSSNTNVNVNISGLTAGTIYHFRSLAVNSLGAVYGSDLTFKTLGQIPTCSTKDVSNIQLNSVTLNGIVNANLLSTVVTFEYGTTSSYGQSAIAIQSPVTGNTPSNVSVIVSGLVQATLYHYRIKAENELGITTGNDLTFNTLTALSDIDGNNYTGVTLGNQVWMTENLKTTKYSNGDLIGTTSPATLDITGESTPKYQWAYNGNESYVSSYGRLYTWYTVTDSRNICPTGWHVPDDTEWSILTTYLGGETFAGGKLKEAGLTHWQSPNTGATNETGFTALPGSGRNPQGTPINDFGSTGYWWSSSDYDATYTLGRTLIYNTNSVGRGTFHKKIGFSVRCLQDN
jgi:uncharacterized protein (TIGR02145 family)